MTVTNRISGHLLSLVGAHPATFNLLGWDAARHPRLARAVVAAGHEVGNRTWTHLDLAGQTGRQTQRQLDLGCQAIQAAAVADHLARVVGPGDVIGLHDGIGRGAFDPRGRLARRLRARRLVELAALPAALARLRASGIRLVTASELAEAAGHR